MASMSIPIQDIVTNPDEPEDLLVGEGEDSYLLLRSNVESPWEDEEGRSIQYSRRVPNYTAMAAGVHFLLDRRVREGKKIIARGTIASVAEESGADASVEYFRAEFENYQLLKPPRVVTPEVESALQQLPRYNQQYSIRILTKELFEELAQPPAAWIFQANSQFFDVRSAVRELKEDTWLVLQHKERIKAGDRVYLWESGPDGGMVGLAEVIDPVTIRLPAEEGVPFTRDLQSIGGMQPRVGIRILRAVEPTIGRDEIRAHPSLGNLSILRQPQGTNFVVRAEEAVVLEEMLADRESEPPDQEWLQGPEHETWLRSEVERFKEWQQANESAVQERVAKHEHFARVFRLPDLANLPREEFGEVLHEFLHYHGRVGMTGAWRSRLVRQAGHVQDVLVNLLREVSSGRSVAEAVDDALAEFDFSAIILLSSVLHDFDWDTFAIFFPTQRQRMKRVGIWPSADPRTTGTPGKEYDLACSIQRGFALAFGLNLDRTDKFLWWAEEEDLSYPTHQLDALARIHSHIESRGFLYPKGEIANYYIALMTKPFVILTGLSGTGKTALTRLVPGALGARYELVSVKPNWNDSRDLLGFYNPILERYHPTHFLAFLLEAWLDHEQNQQDALDYFVCLDEMNLARVEYYFAELLSAMESEDHRLGLHRESEDQPGLRTKIEVRGESQEISIPQWITIPPNLYLSGTVNIDETVYPFSDKVKDRANTLELIMDFKGYRELLLGGPIRGTAFKETVYEYARTEEGRQVLDLLGRIHGQLEAQRLHFGYRTIDEVLAYMARNDALGSPLTVEEALDNQIMQKILPKLQGRGEAIKEILWCSGQECSECLHCMCTSAGAQRSAVKIERMHDLAVREGATSFEAAR